MLSEFHFDCNFYGFAFSLILILKLPFFCQSRVIYLSSVRLLHDAYKSVMVADTILYVIFRISL